MSALVSNPHPAAAARNYSLDCLEVDPSWSSGSASEHSIPRAGGVVDPSAIANDTGRTYQGTSEGTYWLPNDEDEQNRLDFQHRLVNTILDNRFGIAPLQDPKHALDVATGTGIWAIEFAERFPNCQVVGSDLSIIQPTDKVPNCTFIRHDAEKDAWDFPHKFDYIHLRYMCSCFDDPEAVIQKAYDALAPGGYIEFWDVPMEFQSLEDNLEGTVVSGWQSMLREASFTLGRDTRKVYKYPEWLTAAGFVDVQRTIFPTALNGWPKDPKQKDIGRMMLPNYVEITALASLFAKSAGADGPQVDALTNQLHEAMRDPKMHLFHEMTAVYGKKPE